MELWFFSALSASQRLSTLTNNMSRMRDAPTCIPSTFPFLSRLNQTTNPCTAKWSLYIACIGKLVAGRCLINAWSASTDTVSVAPASSLNQSPLKDARSAGVGVHSFSGTNRVTSLSESTISAHRIALLVQSKLQLVAASSKLTAAHWYNTPAAESGHAVLNYESCRRMRFFIPPDAHKLLQLLV
jgi:hypothetical protein